jgi:5-methylcytosine-specific restriction endonuclease McrA
MAKSKPSDKVEGWTEAKYWGAIRSALRTGMRFYKPKTDLLLKNRKPCKNKGRQKWEYTCESCKQKFKSTDVQVDHIVPAGSLKSYEDLPEFVERLYCGEDNLQVLCKPCHRIKTNHERGSKNE